MEGSIYFIADVHLAMEDTLPEIRKRERLIHFMKDIRDDASELYILGDLFDFWFEWYHVVPGYYFSILHHLRMLVDSGVKVTLLAGNHDFYFRDYIQNQVGLHTCTDGLDITRGGKRFYLAHGDGLGRKDTGYKILKKVIRNPLSVFLFKTLLSADVGMALARRVSKTSRRKKSIDRSTWMEEYYMEFAQKQWQQGFDYVLLGHIHFPQRIVRNRHELVCPGDFITHFSYVKFDGSTLSLHRMN